MMKTQLVKVLCDLNNINFTGREDVEELLKTKCEQTLESLSCTFDDISKRIISIVDKYEGDVSNCEWQYICLNFYIMEILNDELSKSHLEVLSVHEIKNIKAALGNLMLNGILKNLQPNLPHYAKIEKSRNDVIITYNLLKCTAFGFTSLIKHPDLRMLILPHLLQGILVASLQIAFCPLKKPNSSSSSNFFMSEATYAKLIKDQELFKEILEDMRQNIHPAFFVKETMSLFQTDSPTWFKKAISNILTKLMRSQKGVEHIAVAMLDGSENDTTKTWKILDILTKLIMSCKKLPDFQQNICVQVLQLLDILKRTDHDLLVFERLVVSCTKAVYLEESELCKRVFLTRITTPLSHFVSKEYKFSENGDVTDDIEQSVRLLHGCFVDNSVNLPCLPTELLQGFINVLFNFYHLTAKSGFETTSKELKELVNNHLQSCTDDQLSLLFDNFLFGFDIAGMARIRDDVIIEINKEITVKHCEHTVIYATADVADTVFNLLDTNQKVVLFGYLLNCITEKERYFPTSVNKELLSVEDQSSCAILERLLTMHKLLSQLAESKEVQRSLRDKPDNIIKYVTRVLTSDNHNSDFIFTVAMVLDNLITNASVDGLMKYRALIEPISKISDATSNAELTDICNRILIALREKKVDNAKPDNERTEFEKALKDVCDPLLPVRGHGLLVLAKLIEKKDKQAMERKQYLLNLFQLSLKNEDSFIYLNAVQGLAALADVFPDTVLEVLCEEYADFTKKNGEDAEEIRMKLGEVLVRVVKLLGEMAPNYKALLLNTFLSGTKDDDHLIRASSLSNLGEVCRVLNYKLGTIVTEVLVCVHAIITTDKAVEARRAAVTVIRQLFVGLQTEMIAFLKEEILPIYRTLKEIYYHDKDDVMRLQAQLALEELNENMKSFVFPNPQLNAEKKFILLN